MKPDDVKISKTLSYWLRHEPDAGGLAVDAAGWAEVDAVLTALAKQGDSVDWDNLRRVLETNDKQRFEPSADGTLIRARQGHSISVEGDWHGATPPDILWHGTVERFHNAILAEGLKPLRRHHVHLSPARETAQRVGRRRGVPVILIVAAKRLAARGQKFLITGNGVWLTSHVPPAALRRE